MIYYVNLNKKRLVGRNNNVTSRPLTLEYDVTEVIDFQFIDDNNQLQPLSPNTPGFTLAIGLKQNMPSYDLLALSHDYEIVNGQTLRFTVNTYTVNWLKKINKPNTEVFIEISQQSLESKKVWMRDYCYVWPRVWVAGLSPEEIQSKDYWTASETQEYVDNAIEGISGFVTEQQFEEGLATKQNVIDADNKLDYDLLSGTPSIPTKTSDLTNDSGFVTSSDVETAISGKADKSELPTKTSDLDNDSGFITNSALVGYATESYVQGEVSGKQDKITNDNKLDYSLLSSTPTIPVVPTNVSDFTNDAGYQTAQDVQDAISGKQDLIDANNKLDYSLLSGTPTVPTKTSDLQNDSGFITDADLSGKQDVIDANNKLDYSLLSSTPIIPLSTSQLINDSDFVDQSALNTALSLKQDVINSNNKLDYELLSGTPNPTNVVVESIMAPVVNFLGKQIQKVDPTDATSGSVTITFSNLNSIPNGCAPTCELHIAINGNISTITLPAGTSIINMPETLDYIGGKAITYHVITFRAMKDIESNIHVCANYNYKYEEDYL